VTHILHDPVTLTLIPDGDHRLSRDEDLQRLRDAVMRLVDSSPLPLGERWASP
jgi:hypothetical protein